MTHRRQSNPRVRNIKHAQRESFLRHEIAQFFSQIIADEPSLQTLYINRVQLSSDRGLCTVLFAAADGQEEFNEKRATLILYKPSIRKALATVMQSRYTPEIVFRYDKGFEKQRTVNELIDRLKHEGRLS